MTGLRERKKAASRAAMSQAAWRMLLEHGLDAVTPESVAAAADMAPRTFRYHFRNREEAILDGLAQQHMALAARIRERPAGEPVWDSLRHVLPAAVTEMFGDRAEFAKLVAVIADSPAMLAANLLVLEQGRQLMAGAIGERIGRTPQTDVYPGLLAGVAGTAISIAVTHWARGDDDTPLGDLIRDCLDRLRAGLPLETSP
ncbi:TetR family transcriptional regulator [Actinoplanes sp. NPDC023936]|uniref:TetR/AcrR family transcriptional regulator n=1 Tax=Actinoplanes sp. NPDC023936 TaxID=3154910 RepID=UPI003406EA81